MSSIVPDIDQWFESLTTEALARIDVSTCIWLKYKSDVEEVKANITSFPNKLSHDVMVPIGSKALMRGKLTHTNEFMVNLGETWFVKQASSQTLDICNRRLNKCKDMLERLVREKDLIVKKQTLQHEKEAFGCEERPEIIEHISEEEDLKWKQLHQIKEREYRQQLAEFQQKNKMPIETEEDLWTHLDELELQEELEDELNRLLVDITSEDDTSEEDRTEESCDNLTNISSDKSKVIEDVFSASGDVKQNRRNSIDPDFDESCLNEIKIKRRVSFVLELDDCPDDGPLRIEFRHSSNGISPGTSDKSVINSPGDIYLSYLKFISVNPVSILRVGTNPNKEIELSAIEKDESDINADFVPNLSSLPGIKLADIIERNVSVFGKNRPLVEATKKVSKFKASRLKKGSS